MGQNLILAYVTLHYRITMLNISTSRCVGINRKPYWKLLIYQPIHWIEYSLSTMAKPFILLQNHFRLNYIPLNTFITQYVKSITIKLLFLRKVFRISSFETLQRYLRTLGIYKLWNKLVQLSHGNKYILSMYPKILLVLCLYQTFQTLIFEIVVSLAVYFWSNFRFWRMQLSLHILWIVLI